MAKPVENAPFCCHQWLDLSSIISEKSPVKVHVFILIFQPTQVHEISLAGSFLTGDWVNELFRKPLLEYKHSWSICSSRKRHCGRVIFYFIKFFKFLKNLQLYEWTQACGPLIEEMPKFFCFWMFLMLQKLFWKSNSKTSFKGLSFRITP